MLSFDSRRLLARLTVLLGAIGMLLPFGPVEPRSVLAQNTNPPLLEDADADPIGLFPDRAAVPDRSAEAANGQAFDPLDDRTELDATADSADALQAGRIAAAESGIPPLNVLELLLKGRWLMLPILIMSIAVVMLAFERSLSIRRARILPEGLLEGLTDISGVPGVMDPRRAYRLCQQYPSPAASVIRAMLLKIGRPHSEVEHAVAESSEREAERLYGNVRWLNLIAAIAPLTGLLGTVWGMIRAFYDTTHIAIGQNKAEFLAEGIYVALVTTLGGLVVAIPAAVLAHFFEGRLIALFHQVDELMFSLMPQIERYEGRARVTPHSLGGADDSDADVSEASHADGLTGQPLPATDNAARAQRDPTAAEPRAGDSPTRVNQP